jgi:hypothetical protein
MSQGRDRARLFRLWWQSAGREDRVCDNVALLRVSLDGSAWTASSGSASRFLKLHDTLLIETR